MFFSFSRSIMVKSLFCCSALLSTFCFANQAATLSSDNEQSVAEQFETCRISFKDQAQSAGFSSLITEDVISQLAPIERVIELDQKQPEFVESFNEYINKRVNNFRLNKGREKLKEHKQLLQRLKNKYGVPPQYLVSFWGLETNYGAHKGKMSVLNSLATLACDQRRSSFFTKQLFDAFTLLDTQQVIVEQLQGSWAGAMGHLQFMPSSFLQYATDGDNDGKVDIWQSEADALTTAANYLQQIGWQEKERWGREVKLPTNFAFNKVELDRQYSLSTFATLGVKTIDGKALPHYDTQAELVLPSGYQGPAFLVYKNYHVIMQWNLSMNYALAVGLLADRLSFQSGMKNEVNSPITYRAEQLKLLQEKLNNMGFDVGKPDGIWGPKSRQAIRLFQLENNLVADGFPNPEVFLQAKIL